MEYGNRHPFQNTDNAADLRLILGTIPGGVFCCLYDEPLTLTFMSEGFLSMTGYTRDQLRTQYGDSLRALIWPEDLPPTLRSVQSQMAEGDVKLVEYRLRCADGRVIWVLDKGCLLHTSVGPDIFCCIIIDVTEQVVAERELRLSLERHRILMEQTNDIIFEWRADTRELVLSSNWSNVFENLPDSSLPIRYDLGFITDALHIHPMDAQRFLDAIQPPGDGAMRLPDLDIRIRTRGGAYSWFQLRVSLQRDEEGRILRYIGLLRDIDAEKSRAVRLAIKAERDELTGLYNRRTAREMIEERLRQSPSGVHLLMILDLDNFKSFNDTRGHLYGDAVLTAFSDRLSRLFRSTDIVCRYGGDEFIVFLSSVNDATQALTCAQTVLLAARGVADELKDGVFTCSIGLALYPHDAAGFEQLFQAADAALYRAKEKGKNNAVLYSQSDCAMCAPSSSSDGENEECPQDEPCGHSELTQSVFSLLYTAPDPATAIPLVLEMLGRRYGVSRTYIFEISADRRTFSNTFEWCAAGIAAEKDGLQGLLVDRYDEYFSNFDERGVFYCHDISRLPASQQAALAPQGVQSVLQCILSDGSRHTGFVGFDACQKTRYWDKQAVDGLMHCSHILGVFLAKHRLREEVERLQNPDR